jgi:hypothetical protein
MSLLQRLSKVVDIKDPQFNCEENTLRTQQFLLKTKFQNLNACLYYGEWSAKKMLAKTVDNLG